MAPGSRTSKRVRAEGSEVQPPQSQTRTSKRLHLLATQGQTEEGTTQRSCTPAESGIAAPAQETTAAEEESAGAAQDTTSVDEDNEQEQDHNEGK